jgi:hypothetical protein
MLIALFVTFSRSRPCRFSVLVMALLGLAGWGSANYKLLRPFPGLLSAQQSHHEPLSGFSSHASFEQECRHCHVPVHCLSDDSCQGCHLDIARERQAAQGLHGKLLVGSSCRDCHTEHQGREAHITQSLIASEEHAAQTGFHLEMHRVNFGGDLIDCGHCHVAGVVDCLTCHASQDHDNMADHVAEFGTNCRLCHDGRQREEPFSHSPLFFREGAHEREACAGCHDGYEKAEVARDCQDCHEEPALHAGSFGLACRRCHTSNDGWLNARLLLHTFPLDHGDEGQLACERCHQPNYTVYTCEACHEAEVMLLAHPEEQTEPGYTECAGCHGDGQRTSAGPEP